MRSKANIIITGTPGVGKTSHAYLVAQRSHLKHMQINSIVQQRKCYESWDATLDTYVVDDDKLLDSIEVELQQGGYVIDWHACELFPKAWIDLVVVLRSNNTVLYDRLTKRSYSDRKLEQNIDAEIMQVILDEAREAYDSEIVIELQSNTSEDLENNVDRIIAWIDAWTSAQGSE